MVFLAKIYAGIHFVTKTLKRHNSIIHFAVKKTLKIDKRRKHLSNNVEKQHYLLAVMSKGSQKQNLNVLFVAYELNGCDVFFISQVILHDDDPLERRSVVVRQEGRVICN